MNTITPATSFSRRKTRLLGRATSLCIFLTFTVAFFASSMTAFAAGVGDNLFGGNGLGFVTDLLNRNVKVVGTITFGSQIKLPPNQAVDPQNHLPVFAFNVTPPGNASIPQGTWALIQWNNIDCKGNKLQPPTKLGFGTLNGDNVTYGQGANSCDQGAAGNIKNRDQLPITSDRRGSVNSSVTAKFVGSLVKSQMTPQQVSFDLSPQGYSLINGKLQSTLTPGDWIVVSVGGQTVFAMYTRRGGQDMALLGDGTEQLPTTLNVKSGNFVKLLPNDGTLSQQSGGIISWAGTGWL